MALLSWSDQYLIGHTTIDAEHRELFRLINDFHSRWSEGHQRQEIGQVLNRLVQYAELHFQHEEGIMAAAGYPQLATHKQAHERLYETIYTLHRDYAEQGRRLEQDTMKFVKNWLVEHILNNDYAFRDFLARRKAAGEAASGETAAE